MTAATCMLRGAGFSYAKAKPIFTAFDLDIEVGARLAITGPSGAGKSTLLNVLGLLEPLTAGEYRLDDQLVTGLRRRELARVRARHIGFVFQSFHLIPQLSAIENVMLGGRYVPDRRISDDSREAARLLQRVGLETFESSLPLEMSGGQQQRVAIARALMGSPSLVLCDEPTGNLDRTTGESVLSLLLDEAPAEQTVVIVTHDEAVVKRCERALRVEPTQP